MAVEGVLIRQDRLILFLLSEPNSVAACRKAKVSQTVYYEWLREDAAFVGRLRDARTRVFEATLTSLVGIAGACVEAVRDGLNKKNSTRDRLRAAKIGLDQLVKIAPVADLAEKMEQLRLELAGLNATRPDHTPAHVPGLPGAPAPGQQDGRPDGNGESGGVGFEERPDPALPRDGLAGGPVAGEVPDLDDE